MSKKKNKIVAQKSNKWLRKVRPFMLPLFFVLGSIGAYFINANELMTKVKDQSNVSPQSVFLVQILVYIGIIGFIFLGYKFQSLMDKRAVERVK